MLQACSSLMKAAQRIDVFVCDYLAGMKILQTNLTNMYVNEKTRFMQEAFWDFNALVNV
jgi:hypothetical protein